MSIFNDKNFLSEIEKIFVKKAQDTNITNNLDLAARLINSLSNQDLTSPVRPVSQGEDSQPSQADLVSLDSFINYLKKLQFGNMPGSPNGLTIVAPLDTNTPAEGYTKYKNLQVNKDGLIAALQYFFSIANKSGNLYLKELIGKLIDDAKMSKELNLPAEALNTKQEEKVDPNAAPSDDTVLDAVNSHINLKQEMYPDANGKITAGDLKDENINDFVKRFSISVDGKDKYVPLDFSKENSNDNPICVFLNYLHERGTKKSNKFYIAQIERFMGEKHCAVGDNSFDVSQQTSSNEQNPNAKNVSYQEVGQALQEGGGTPSLILPFDVETDNVNIDRFKRFIGQVDELISKQFFISEMGMYINQLRSSIFSTQRAIINWEGAATPAAVNGGFSLTTTQDVKSFVQTFADNDYNKARDMLNSIVPVCRELASIVRVLSASKILQNMVGEDMFREQYQTGLNYVNVANGLMSQINSIVKAGK
jgi:hypothetical protein